jgi:hypothetical protein
MKRSTKSKNTSLALRIRMDPSLFEWLDPDPGPHSDNKSGSASQCSSCTLILNKGNFKHLSKSSFLVFTNCLFSSHRKFTAILLSQYTILTKIINCTSIHFLQNVAFILGIRIQSFFLKLDESGSAYTRSGSETLNYAYAEHLYEMIKIYNKC